MQAIQTFFSLRWQSVAMYGGLFVALGVLLFWQLGTLLPGYSQAEANTLQSSINLRQLLDNPLNAPFIIAVRALNFVSPGDYLATRLTATGFGLATLMIFCWLLRVWHDSRTAIIGTLLFGTSAWFLHVSRVGTPDVLLFGIFALAACGFWLKQHRSWIALLACFLLVASLLYVPGIIWFVIAGLVWQWRTIDHVFKKQLISVSAGTLLLTAALAPLGWAFYKDTSLIMTWLGLPDTWPAPLTILRNIIELPYHLFVSGERNPAMWLGTAAVLDVFALVMFIIGGWLYVRHLKLMRTPLFLSLLGIAALLIGVGSSVTLTAAMPFVYLVVAAGTTYLMSQWLSVFPRNPIAKGVGMGLLTLVVSLACIYQLRHYFVGFPQAQTTHTIYTIQERQ